MEVPHLNFARPCQKHHAKCMGSSARKIMSYPPGSTLNLNELIIALIHLPMGKSRGVGGGGGGGGRRGRGWSSPPSL